MAEKTRCSWAQSELMARYHDEEWGVPERDDGRLFEMLTLEGAQAGLSWETVLKKREGYRTVFHGFNIAKVAQMTAAEVDAAVANPGIIRHRGKIESAVSNAQAILKMRDAGEAFAAFLWSFVGDSPIVNVYGPGENSPAKTAESDAMSKALMIRGFRFVGSTICYAFMQASGMVSDHSSDCFRTIADAVASTHNANG